MSVDQQLPIQPLSSASGSHHSTRCCYELDCSGCKWDHAAFVLLWLALRHIALCPHGFFRGYSVPGCASVSRLNDIPLCVLIIFSAVIHPLMDVLVASTSCLFPWLVSFFTTPRHMGSQFSDQELNPDLQQWKLQALTTGPSENSFVYSFWLKTPLPQKAV